jgi:hypothetical protein
VGERLGLQDEEVQDLEARALRQLTVDELVRYCDALGMLVTITVGVHSRPAGKVEILSTRKRRPRDPCPELSCQRQLTDLGGVLSL